MFLFPKVIVSLLLACMTGTGVRAEVFSIRAPVTVPHEAAVAGISDHGPRIRHSGGGFSIELRSGTHPHLQRWGWQRYRPYWDTPYYRNYKTHRFDLSDSRYNDFKDWQRPGYRYHRQRGWPDRAPYYNGRRFLFEVEPERPAARPGHGQWAAHLAWCRDRYRSYRAADNTFQPYKGPRRKCRSPYGR